MAKSGSNIKKIKKNNKTKKKKNAHRKPVQKIQSRKLRKKSQKKSVSISLIKPSLPKKSLLRFPRALQKHGQGKLYPDPEQGILPEKGREQRKEDMISGEMNEDIDTEEGRELMVEEDEIEPWEAGFAEGASEEGQLAKDALTGEPLIGTRVVEKEIEGKLYRFSSLKNAQKFQEKKIQEKKRRR